MKATELTENIEKNLKMENNKNIIDGDCWVAYFDILGFKGEVEWAEKNHNKFILSMCECAYEERNLKEKFKEFTNGLVKIICFSDTFIFYSSNDSGECLSAIEHVARQFFRAMFTAKWHAEKEPHSGDIPVPLRGCLNYGHFYADRDKNIYWGSALNEAYELAESQDWIGYVLSEKAKSQIDKCHFNYWKTIEPYYKEYNVPMKDLKTKKLFKKKLYAYYAGEYKVSSLDILRDHAGFDLADGLFRMWINIKDNNNLTDKQKISKKYRNTKDFLLEAYPTLPILKDIGENKSL